MKLFLTFIFLIFIFSGCSSVTSSSWNTPTQVRENSPSLEIGDILIKKKGWGMYQWFGHCGMLIDNFNVVDFPSFKAHMHITPIEKWASGKREIIVLRVKDRSDEFKLCLIQNILKESDKHYKIGLDKKDESGFYCSQFVWDMYYVTSKQFGNPIDLDSDKGIFVFPYDFYDSEYVKKIKY